MSVESDKVGRQFENAKDMTIAEAHAQVVASVQAAHQKVIVGQQGGFGTPGFVAVHVDGKRVALNDPNAFDQVKP